MSDRAGLVSVVIPARNEATLIGRVVEAVRGQDRPEGVELEVLVVDDGSADETAERAEVAGARVLRREVTAGSAGRPAAGVPAASGNPAAARNLGAETSRGDPIVFLDADCVPAPGWLEALLAAHDRGETVVGGSLDLPPGLRWTARCDYYCGWYLVHPRRPPGPVPHHPPPNLSVRREPFLSTSGFTEEPPFSYTNEERAWQGELRRAGHRIWFEPAARAFHHNRPGLGALLRRNYRWASTAVAAKGSSGAARMAWLYRHPWLLVLGSPLLVLAHTGYILAAWTRAGVYEPLLMLPWVLASRVAYVAGLVVGGWRWRRVRRGGLQRVRVRPMWRSRHLMPEEYFGRPDVVREYASLEFLLPPEQVILDVWAPRLPRARMLDIGVGGGRTTLHFVDRVAEYVGIDCSQAMIAACTSRFGDRLRAGVSFLVADARDLGAFDAESFDVVLFAFQGLDSLSDHGERLGALAEIHRVLAPGGVFAFSSSNLHSLRDALSLRKAIQDLLRPPGRGLDPLVVLREPRRTVRTLARPLRLRRRNLGYAIEPTVQVAQLASAGFVDVRILSPPGNEVTEENDRSLRQFPWLYYMCTKRRRSAPVGP